MVHQHHHTAVHQKPSMDTNIIVTLFRPISLMPHSKTLPWILPEGNLKSKTCINRPYTPKKKYNEFKLSNLNSILYQVGEIKWFLRYIYEKRLSFWMRQNDNARFGPEAMTKSRVFPPHFTLVTCQFIMPLVDFRQLKGDHEKGQGPRNSYCGARRYFVRLEKIAHCAKLMASSFLKKVLTPKHLDGTHLHL